jgi:hypothetical protein
MNINPLGFEILPEASRLKVKVENPKGSILRPFSYVKHYSCSAHPTTPSFFFFLSYLSFSSFFALNHIF